MSCRFIACVAIAAVFGVALGCTNTKKDGSAPDAPAGAATVTMVKFDGLQSAIAAEKGKVVLIDFWATWCSPCVESFPKLVQKHQKYAGKGLAVISVSLDDPEDFEKVAAFLKKNHATFTNLHMDEDGATQQGLKDKFQYEGLIPHAVLIDRMGKRVWTGHPMNAELEHRINAELAK